MFAVKVLLSLSLICMCIWLTAFHHMLSLLLTLALMEENESSSHVFSMLIPCVAGLNVALRCTYGKRMPVIAPGLVDVGAKYWSSNGPPLPFQMRVDT